MRRSAHTGHEIISHIRSYTSIWRTNLVLLGTGPEMNQDCVGLRARLG